MMENIFVGLLIVIAIGAGIWVWWFENMGGKSEETNNQTQDKTAADGKK